LRQQFSTDFTGRKRLIHFDLYELYRRIGLKLSDQIHIDIRWHNEDKEFGKDCVKAVLGRMRIATTLGLISNRQRGMRLLSRPLQCFKNLAVHQESDFGGGQRLLAFG
jgi:hypothetical protein